MPAQEPALPRQCDALQLKVKRRAAELHRSLLANPEAGLGDPLMVMDWVNLYALVPSVLQYYARFIPGANEDGIVRFLLTAGAIGVLLKENASISGAEVGCQAETGAGMKDKYKEMSRGGPALHVVEPPDLSVNLPGF